MISNATKVEEAGRVLPLALLVGVAMVSPLGINMYAPSMSGMARSLSVDFAAIQLTFSVFLGTLAIGQLIVGPLSDRVGRRPVLLVGLTVFTLGSGLCTTARTFEVLIFGRIVQALGASAVVPLCRAVVRDVYARDKAASMYAYVTMGMSVSSMVGPLIGGLLDGFGWRASFLCMTVCGAVALSSSYWRFHETRPGGHSITSTREMLRGYVDLVQSQVFWGYVLVVAFVSASFFVLIAGAPYILIELMGNTPAEAGFYCASMPVGYLFGGFTSGRFVVKAGPDRMVFAGTLLALLGMGVMGLAFACGIVHPLSISIPMFVVGVANGLVMPNGVAGAISVKPKLAGAAAGLSGSFQIGFSGLCTAIVGEMLTTSVWPLIGVISVCLLFGIASFGLVKYGDCRHDNTAPNPLFEKSE